MRGCCCPCFETGLLRCKRLMQEAAAATMRGKKGKAKKAQAKYAHQDEHDRQLALQLLDPAGHLFFPQRLKFSICKTSTIIVMDLVYTGMPRDCILSS